MAKKQCPFLKEECIEDMCQLWVEKTKNCAIASKPEFLDDDQFEFGEPFGKKLS